MIEWLILDKFIKDKEFKQIFYDKMTLLYEYGNRREQKGRNEEMKEILESLINSGDSLFEISKKTGKTIQELKNILDD